MIVFLIYKKMPEKTDFTAKTKFFEPSFSTFFMDDLGLFCLYLRYFPSYQLGSLRILKLRLWGFWKYVIFPEKHWPGLRTSQNKKSSRNPVLAGSHRKLGKYRWKQKFFEKLFADLNSARKNTSIEKKNCRGKYGNGREFAGYPLEF